MIVNAFIVFLAFCVWKTLALVNTEEGGLALAQLSRTKPEASSQDGTVRLSRVDKPEDLTFEAPSLPHAQGGLGEAEVDMLRSLTLSDTVLLASIDGRFHAVNRTTGRTIWSMEDDSDTSPSQSLLHSLVRTDHNLSPSIPPDSDNQELCIIEPQSGDIFVLSSSPSEGMSSPHVPLLAGHLQVLDWLTFIPLDGSNSPEPLRRLPYSVPQLVEHSPFSFDDPNRVFVGKKETSIIEVDLDEGIVKSVMGGTNSWHHDGEEDEASDDLPKSRNRRIVQVGRTGASPC
jgi:serine/threonine-protein kinase/endoribonuclease IRE1